MKTWLFIRVVFCSLAFVMFGVACSSSAHITRRGAPPLSGEITRSDAEALYVEVENNDWVTVPRADIESVDHPGNVAGVIGTTIFVVGAGLAMATVPFFGYPSPRSFAGCACSMIQKRVQAGVDGTLYQRNQHLPSFPILGLT